SPRQDRLISNQNGAEAGLINHTDGFHSTFDQFQIVGRPNAFHFDVQGTVTIQKNGWLGVYKRIAVDAPGLEIRNDFFEPVGRTGIFDILATIISKKTTAVGEHHGEQIFAEVEPVGDRSATPSIPVRLKSSFVESM